MSKKKILYLIPHLQNQGPVVLPCKEHRSETVCAFCSDCFSGAGEQYDRAVQVIEAFKEAELQDAVLLVLGDGVFMERCKAIANDRVIFTGRVNNVKEYLYASDLLISASSAEGLPYAILEAECTGIPMILSDIQQHREAVGENVGQVEFFHCGNKTELLDKIVKKAKVVINEKCIILQSLLHMQWQEAI